MDTSFFLLVSAEGTTLGLTMVLHSSSLAFHPHFCSQSSELGASCMLVPCRNWDELRALSSPNPSSFIVISAFEGKWSLQEMNTFSCIAPYGVFGPCKMSDGTSYWP